MKLADPWVKQFCEQADSWAMCWAKLDATDRNETRRTWALATGAIMKGKSQSYAASFEDLAARFFLQRQRLSGSLFGQSGRNAKKKETSRRNAKKRRSGKFKGARTGGGRLQRARERAEEKKLKGNR